MTRTFTIQDTATNTTLSTDADKWTAAEAIRSAFPDAPADVTEAMERLASGIENDAWDEGDAAFLALDIDAEIA